MVTLSIQLQARNRGKVMHADNSLLPSCSDSTVMIISLVCIVCGQSGVWDIVRKLVTSMMKLFVVSSGRGASYTVQLY